MKIIIRPLLAVLALMACHQVSAYPTPFARVAFCSILPNSPVQIKYACCYDSDWYSRHHNPTGLLWVEAGQRPLNYALDVAHACEDAAGADWGVGQETLCNADTGIFEHDNQKIMYSRCTIKDYR